MLGIPRNGAPIRLIWPRGDILPIGYSLYKAK